MSYKKILRIAEDPRRADNEVEQMNPESGRSTQGRSIGRNMHQPKPGSQAAGQVIRRGEGGGCGVEWALRVARRWGWDRVSPSWEPGERDAGDHKGNKCRTHPLRTTLAPTEFDGLFLG